MKPTDTNNPEYFHKVVDCQYACPAHTPVPEYIRLIAAGRYSDAYMVNWESNVFPGILGRTCDRPCEPACRRGRVEDKPVAICRLKRVCADMKDDITARLPKIPKEKNGFKLALIGAGPSALTVARDLMPLGYEIDLFEATSKAGGFMRQQIPSFRLPAEVIDEETGYILDMGVNAHFNTRIESMKALLEKGYDAVFVGSGAPSGRVLKLPGYELDGGKNVQIGVEWLAQVAFGHQTETPKDVIVIGGGNTAMDCCRTALRLGAENVKVLLRTPISAMVASPWEIEDTQAEGIPILENHNPLEYIVEDGQLKAMKFEVIEYSIEDGREVFTPTGQFETVGCGLVLLAIGQANAFKWIERDLGIEFNEIGLAKVDDVTYQSTHPKVFFGGDAAFGPKNIITAVAQGHQAAVSIDLFLNGKDLQERPDPSTNLLSQKMGIHEWSYASMVSEEERNIVPHVDLDEAIHSHTMEVELGFDAKTALEEAERCLNCDVETVFTADKCIECDACIDICPVDCLTFTKNEEEAQVRRKLNVPAHNLSQDLFVSENLNTGRVMVKDEDVCLHCGLCAERCPTSAWDMQKFLYIAPTAKLEND
ncbi:FAD-dependent oxidoreductase [Pontiella sulfatireligans]|uniref:NADPH-Fe(3+) oxidoreductase subunit beta n=1 Tax=Pontiella sulfatireligans TaxID=2750658 RepID=A0A6C2UL92_9BACT|nr:FAD-dependent oxidoreductase [Pontiella sulfatireligans]VGO20181.1 NADPH-Fe(3+) oxidoreductase subunit beta [Pontiella sulfatireligans]